jgi:hypothetical protein
MIVMLVLGLAVAAAEAAVSVGPARPATKTPAGTAATPADKAPLGPAADDVKARLMAEAVKGKLTDPLLALFRESVMASARDKLVPSAIPEGFWNWVSTSKEFRGPILIDLFQTHYDPAVLKCLLALKTHFPEQVPAYAHLALAFAFVYGHAGAKSIRGPEVMFTDKERPVPSMEESFDYYLKNERAMRLPLKTTPWPLLVYVADNDVPLAERTWALQHYASLQPAGFAKIYYDVPYDNAKINGPGMLGGKPATLLNILTCGGICMHQAYYASRVFKSMGVPAVYDHGEGERGGHAWVAWVGKEGQGVGLLFSGRFDYDRYYTGIVHDPINRFSILDRDLELEAVAMAKSYQGYLDAMAACQIGMMFPKDDAAKMIGLLDGATLRNPYCAVPWRLVAALVAEGVIPAAQGERMYDGMLKSFADYPDLTFWVLRKILTPRLKPAVKPADTEITRNLKLLDRAFQLYDKAARPDLAVKLLALQGQYLEGVGRRDDALKLYTTASEKYASQHYGFLELYDRAVKLMEEDRKQDLLLKYMAMMANAVPEFQSDFNRTNKLTNPAFAYVVKTYATALRKAGKTADASQWEARLPKKKD